MLVAEETEARGGEAEKLPGDRLETDPAGGQHSEKVTAGEEQRISAGGANPPDDAVGPQRNLRGGLATGTAIPKQLPVGLLSAYVCRFPSLVQSVVPLEQIGVGFGHGSETGELTGARGALERTGEHRRETQPLQPRA